MRTDVISARVHYSLRWKRNAEGVDLMRLQERFWLRRRGKCWLTSCGRHPQAKDTVGHTTRESGKLLHGPWSCSIHSVRSWTRPKVCGLELRSVLERIECRTCQDFRAGLVTRDRVLGSIFSKLTASACLLVQFAAVRLTAGATWVRQRPM